MKLIKYRDWGTSTYTYFWVSEDDKILSPYFDSQSQAESWMESQEQKLKDSKNSG